jgi:hypothetical protein
MPARNDIPGLKRLPKPNGYSTWYWAASQISRVADFRPRTVRLWHGCGEPSSIELDQIRAQAIQLSLDLQECRATKRAYRSKRGVVYFVKAGERVKIGFTVDVERRLSQLQALFPDDLELVLSIPGSILMEKELHRRFQAFQLKREWFLYSAQISAFVEKMVSENIMPTVRTGLGQNRSGRSESRIGGF